MPLEPFDNKTFVAFTDIAGFGAMMREGNGRAVQALNAFYSVGYNTIRAQPDSASRVDGLFISDCGILFVRDQQQVIGERLDAMLAVVESIHRRCSEQAVFLTTTITWGHFSYHERIDFTGIEKNPIYGNGYVDAFADNNGGTPKIYSGECRIVRRELPSDAAQYCMEQQGVYASRLRPTEKHFYFEWTRLSAQTSRPKKTALQEQKVSKR